MTTEANEEIVVEEQKSQEITEAQEREYAFADEAAVIRAFVDVAVSQKAEDLVRLSFSSNTPILVQDMNGRSIYEVLVHTREAIDASRLNARTVNLLNGHNWNEQIGKVVAWDTDGTKAYADVRFGTGALAREALADWKAGIRTEVSVGFKPLSRRIERAKDGGLDTCYIDRWLPHEISLVAVPADITVGARSLQITKNNQNQKEPTLKGQRKHMTEETKNVEVITQADLNRARQEATEAANNRVNTIMALGQLSNQLEMAREFVVTGKSVEEAQAKFIEANKTRDIGSNKADELGLTDKEVRQYSFFKAVRAIEERNPNIAPFEMECSRAAEKLYGKASQGFMVPVDIQVRGTATVAGSNIGQNLVGTDHLAGSFIEGLYAKTVMNAAGAYNLGVVQGNVEVPKQGVQTSAYWVGENSAPTTSSWGDDKITLSPKTIAVSQGFSRKLYNQSSPNVEALIRNDMLKNLALGVDKAMILGSGSSNQPLGVINQSNVTALDTGTNGTAMDWATVLKISDTIQSANADVNGLKVITHPKMVTGLRSTLKVSGSTFADYLMNNRTDLDGYPVLTSTQIPVNATKGTGTNLKTLIAGDFSQVVYAIWAGLDVRVDPYSGSTKGETVITMFQDMDIAIRHPESFVYFKYII